MYTRLAAECRSFETLNRETLAELATAEAAIRATLSPEQTALFDAYENAFGAHYLNAADRHIAELARHAPGLAPAINALWRHILGPDGIPGSCCEPAEGFEA